MLKHAFPLGVMAIGSTALFLTNIVIRLYGTSEQFQDWSYIATYLTLFFSFSVLGAEQLIIRFSKYDNEKTLILTRATIQFFLIGFAIFLGFFLFFLNGKLFAYTIAPVNALALLIAISILQALYQKNRLLGANTLGQLTFNMWRIILFVIFSVLLLFHIPFNLEKTVTLIIICSVFLAFLISNHNTKIYIEHQYKREGGIFGALAISLFCMTILGLLDRLLIENTAIYKGLNFENYYYLITLVVFPFNMLANYIGYVTAPNFKTELRWKSFWQLSTRVILGSIGLSIAWCGLLKLSSDLISLSHISSISWFLLVILISIRCGYAVLSSATAVRATASRIFESNLLSILCFIIIIIIGINNIMLTEHLLAIYVLAWICRYTLFLISLRGEWQ